VCRSVGVIGSVLPTFFPAFLPLLSPLFNMFDTVFVIILIVVTVVGVAIPTIDGLYMCVGMGTGRTAVIRTAVQQ